MERYRFDEYKSIQKGFKDYFGLDHAQALLDKENRGNHHPDNIHLLLKYHNGKKNNKSWKRFKFNEQELYIKDAINFHSNVANRFDIQIDNQVLSSLISRLKDIYDS
jgi:hypothetical protein